MFTSLSRDCARAQSDSLHNLICSPLLTACCLAFWEYKAWEATGSLLLSLKGKGYKFHLASNDTENVIKWNTLKHLMDVNKFIIESKTKKAAGRRAGAHAHTLRHRARTDNDRAWTRAIIHWQTIINTEHAPLFSNWRKSVPTTHTQEEDITRKGERKRDGGVACSRWRGGGSNAGQEKQGWNVLYRTVVWPFASARSQLKEWGWYCKTGAISRHNTLILQNTRQTHNCFTNQG